MTPDCNKKRLWSRIVAAVPDANIRSCRQSSDALRIPIGNSEQDSTLRFRRLIFFDHWLRSLAGAEVKPLKPVKCRVVTRNFDSEAVSDEQLRESFGGKLNKVVTLLGKQLTLELNDFDMAENASNLAFR